MHQLIDSKAKFLLTIGMFLETASKASKGEGSKGLMLIDCLCFFKKI